MSIDTWKEEMQKPWPIHDVVSKLVEASEILLHKKNYDGYGWEEISHAVAYAKQWLEEKEIELPDWKEKFIEDCTEWVKENGVHQYTVISKDPSQMIEWIENNVLVK